MVELAFTELAGSEDAERVVVVGPSLGTAVAPLWARCADLLPPSWRVFGWDLPGHGASPAATQSFSVEDLAGAVRRHAVVVAGARPVSYAGVSLGGAVGFVLAFAPGPFDVVVSLASAAKIGTSVAWFERAEAVRTAGTRSMVAGSAERWFAPGFRTHDRDAADGLLKALVDVDDESYAKACEALAHYDVRDRSGMNRIPFLRVGGRCDVVIPTSEVGVVLEGVGHLPPIEDPASTAAVITKFFVTNGNQHE